MENQLYSLPYPRYLPVLEEPDQQVVWSKSRFEEGILLLYLRDFDLREENLAESRRRHLGHARPWGMATAVEKDYNKILHQARKEFEETGNVKGFLFLAPNLRKIWLSHYDVEYLKKIS